MKTTVLAGSAIALSLLGSAALAAACPNSDAKRDSKTAHSNAAQVVLAAHVTETATTTMPDKNIVQTAMGNENFSTLVTAIKAANLADALSGNGPFTVFAPTNAAFAKVDKAALAALLKDPEALASVLKYHVVSGKVLAADVTKLSGAVTLEGQRIDIDTSSGVKVDNAKVTSTDIVCSNGVIHVIDTVLMPSTKNLVETAVAAGSFKTLAKALDAAGLTSTLEGDGPFTVFAPTDEAFAKLPKDTLANLLKPENREQLKGILLYHVVPGRIYSDAAVKAGSAKTIQGASLAITVKSGKAMVNNAGLVKTDIDASNGVIHVIDTVVMPPAK